MKRYVTKFQNFVEMVAGRKSQEKIKRRESMTVQLIYSI
jgi:hypothetical protein